MCLVETLEATPVEFLLKHCMAYEVFKIGRNMQSSGRILFICTRAVWTATGNATTISSDEENLTSLMASRGSYCGSFCI